MLALRQNVHRILGLDEPDDPQSTAFDIALSVLILLNVVTLVLSTVSSIHAKYRVPLEAFEAFSVALFTVEYLLRLWSTVENRRYARPVLGRLRWALTPYALADLVAILPFYLTLGAGIDLRFVRVLRLLRLARVVKLGRYSEGMRALGKVVRSRIQVLTSASVVLLVMLLLSSGFLFYAEHEAQPEKYPNLALALFWAFSVMVGDVGTVAVTTFGRFVVAFIALLGVGLFALPAGVLASGLVEVLRDDPDKGEAEPEAEPPDGHDDPAVGPRGPTPSERERRRPAP